MEAQHARRWKVAGLVLGCCAKFVTGSVFVFSVYQGVIKDTFNYTQKQVEIMSSMMNIGLGVGFLPGMFYDRFGPRWSSALGLAIALAAHTLIWSTTKSVAFYSRNAWLMAVYFFLAGTVKQTLQRPILGLGSVFMYMVALNTNGINFEKQHAGKVIGLLNAMFAASQAVFPLLYYHLFTRGDITNTDQQDFPGFVLMLITCYTVVGLLCVFFLRIQVDEIALYTPLEDITYNGANDESGDKSTDSSPESSLQFGAGVPTELSEARLTVCQILRNTNYQLILWMFGFASCIGLVYVNNITVISQSVHLDRYNDRLTIIIPISSSILSVLIGVVSDRLRHRIQRTSLLLFGCVLFCISQVLVIAFANLLTMLIIATLAVGFGLATLWSITPTVIRENFNARNLGRNWGMAIFVAAFLNFGAQETFGALYDSQVTDKDSRTCYGMACVQGGTAVLVALAAISVIFAVAIILKPRCITKT